MIEVSVITSLYNYKNYIKDCIKSFISQNFDNAEMIIVDDASLDNPYEVIKKYKSNKIRYIRLNKNMGYSFAKNIGIKNCNSDILVMLDADDMLTLNSLKIRYKKLSEGYDFVHGPCLDMKEGRPLVRSRLWDLWNKKNIWKYVHAQGVMLKKDIHRKIGLYDEELRCKSDREFFARVFNYGFKIGTINKDVAFYRRHKKQMHRSKEKLEINNKLQKEVMNKIKRRKKDLDGLEMLK